MRKPGFEGALVATKVDLELLRTFWERKSHEARNRWTSDEMLAFELAYIRALKPRPCSILDLGSRTKASSRARLARGCAR